MEKQRGIKKLVKKAGHYVKAYFMFNDSVRNYSSYIKTANKKKHKAARIVFLIIFPESWNSLKSIYEETKNRSDIETFVIAAPRDMSKYNADADISTIPNDSFDFFVQNNIDVIKANAENTWFDIQAINPDYVIYTRPYNPYYAEQYRSYNVCRYAKVIYIPYAYSMLEDGLTVLPEEFMLSAHRVYLANRSRKEECDLWYPRYNRESKNRFQYLGFPRFDLLAQDADRAAESKFTIAWLPRWTTGDGYKHNKGSNFLNYYNDFLKYAEENPDANIIFRPHPSMFANFLERGIMSEKELEEFKYRCSKCENFHIDQKKDYMDTIRSANVLVADYTSLIAEFFMTGKPIIYCDNAEGLNEEGNSICNNLYNAASFTEIVKLLEKIKNGYDEKKDLRISIIKELLPNECGSIGKTILDSILLS